MKGQDKMRILFTIPHYFKQERGSKYGSGRSNRNKRVDTLGSVIDSINVTFGRKHAFIPKMGTSCNNDISVDFEVIVCTSNDDHAVNDLKYLHFNHIKSYVDPALLGYECHNILKQSINSFDIFCFLEDDILISDSLFFWKLIWFAKKHNEQCILLPNRYETLPHGSVRKLYIDGDLATSHHNWMEFLDAHAPVIKEQIFSRFVEFVRPENPHAGCFFLTREQMIYWASKPYFLDRSQNFVGPLESAATLGISRTFGIYKPASSNASFLEVCHLDNRYLGQKVHYKDDFVLKKPT